MINLKNIIIITLITISFLAFQYFLSIKKHFLWGLIIPSLVIIGGILFLIFEVKDGNYGGWIYKFILLLAVTLSIYFEGREKVKKNKKKELEKMTIKDL